MFSCKLTLVVNTSNMRSFHCDYCSETFKTDYELEDHVQSTHHSDSDEENDMEINNDFEESDVAEEDSDDEYAVHVDVWQVIVGDKEETDVDFQEAFKVNARFARSFKKDPIVKQVMETVDKLMEDEAMKFDEALDAAVYKRRFLLNRTGNAWIVNNNKNNSD